MVKTSTQKGEGLSHIKRFEARPREPAASFDIVNGLNSGLLTIASTDRNEWDKCREFRPGSNGSKMPFDAPGWKLVLDPNAGRWFPSRQRNWTSETRRSRCCGQRKHQNKNPGNILKLLRFITHTDKIARLRA